MADLRQQKRVLRAAMQELRSKAFAQLPQVGVALRDQFLQHVVLPKAAVVSSFRSFGSEISMEPLTEALRSLGHIIVLPVVMGKGLCLQFRRYEAGDSLQRSAFGLDEPLADAAVVEPDLLLVPLLAFDRRHYRLGYGGGFYDRTLTDLRQRKPLLAVGVGFSCQEVAEVPHGVYDARLDKIATEIHVF
jgi:5-formyltetrahydrofolate cyclo-ligase